MNATEHLVLINSLAPPATVRTTRDRRMLVPCCFAVGLLLLSVSAVARSDEPANTEVRDMQPSVRKAGVKPVLLIDEGDPSRPVINNFIRTLQRRSARAGKKCLVVVERIRSSDAQTTHQLDHATYREFPVVLMHGRNACKYAETCFERELFSPGTQFLLLQRYGHEFRSDNDAFRALITEIDTGTVYAQETLQAGLQAFPDQTSLILVAGKRGAYSQMSVDLEKTAARFAEQHKLRFYSASHEELQQIAVAGSQSDCALKLDDILAVPLGRPLVLYWSVWLDGELTCEPREFLDYLAATCNKESRRDSIPILGLNDYFIAPELACLGVCSDGETTVDNVLAAIDGTVTEVRRDNMVLFCEPNAVLERGGDIPEAGAAAAGSNSSPGIRIKYVLPPRLKEFADRAERLAAAEQRASDRLFNASIVILCLISSLAGLAYQRLRRRRLEIELHRRRRALEEAARLATLGTFCAAITHELSQPLAAIMNNADAALKLGTAGLDVSSILEIIADITKDNVRACNVLDRISSFVRSGELQAGRVNLNRFCRELAELASNRCRSAGITLDYVIADDCPDAAADPVILQIILLNLINNAIESIERRKNAEQNFKSLFSIIVTMKSFAKDPSFVSLCVSDNGIGLQDCSPADLLSPFFKSGTTGLGMGLAIVQTLVDQQGGHINITANHEEGITVTILLPKYDSPEDDRMTATTAGSTQFTRDVLKTG